MEIKIKYSEETKEKIIIKNTNQIKIIKKEIKEIKIKIKKLKANNKKLKNQNDYFVQLLNK
jgi:hypothetical protein